MTQYSDWLAHRALVSPQREAIATSGFSLNYRELDHLADRAAGGLFGQGVREGDRVALLAWNSVDFAVTVHACWRLGATVVPMNARLSADEVAWQIQDVEPRILVHDQKTADSAARVVTATGIASARMPLDGNADFRRTSGHASDDVACIMYTSGTTGSPKGAQLTFDNLFASASGSAFNLGIAGDDCWLACLPLFHIGGLSILIRSTLYGTSVLLHETFDERAVAAAIHSGKVTMISVVATMLQRILEVDGRPAPVSLRIVLIGGGPVPKPLLERAIALGYAVIQTYGLTETASQVTTLAPDDALRHVGSAGKPIMSAQLRIDASAGEAGEILVGGAVVTSGYFRRPDATGGAIRDGWLHTGDIGRLDEDGFLYVLDRRDDLIVTGGENVYPAEVEAVLAGHPAVAGCAVVGLPDPTWGHVVAAAVVLRELLTEADLLAHARQRLAAYKVPRTIRFVDELPMTASGKVRRGEVRARWITREST